MADIDEDTPPLEVLQAIQKAVDGRNEMIWAKFQYRCRICRNIEWIGVGVGVEGPTELRKKRLSIPSPFMGMRCLLCKGETMHFNFREDRCFPPVDAPRGMRYFQFPLEVKPDTVHYYNSSAFCGDSAVGTADTPIPSGQPLPYGE